MKFKIKNIVFMTVLAVIFCCGAALAQDSDGKVGIINIQKILVESTAGKAAKAAFEKELEAKRAMVDSKEKALRAAEADLKTAASKIKADVRKTREEKLGEDIKELRRMKQDIEEDLKKKDKELTSDLLKDVLGITKKVADEQKYSLILQAGPQVVYISKGVDITDEVLKRYDAGR